jgi:hypothetical protein
VLQFLNAEFRRRRLQSQPAGQPSIPYTAVQARLRKALVEVAAGSLPPIIQRVFDAQPEAR